ncbi:MAG: TIM barrel protein, partial [Candidatus Poribacteria bacterium]|nr:TIM barrel protein [Candidatus Poribacteria bacterium]
MILGAHVSAAGGLHNAIHNGEELACEAIQIFLKNPNRWVGKEPTEADIDQFRESWCVSSIREVLVHDIHLTNLASPKTDVLANSRKQFRSQMQLADLCGIPYIVTHMGAHLGSGEAGGLQVLGSSLDLLFEQTAGGEVIILLETTAGQGTNLGHRFEHLHIPAGSKL